MIHISELHKVVEKGEFSLAFVATEGEIIRTDRCICTSFHSSGKTMNVKFCESGQVRKVRRITIISINNQDIVL